jgi:uncharacterized protein (TIGR02246 family)
MEIIDLSVSATDESAIRETVTRAHLAQIDSTALPALHTPGVAIVNIAGRRVLGRDALAEAMAAALASPLKDVRTSVEVVDVRMATPDVAVVSCVKTVHDERPGTDPSPLPATGALTYVMTRDGDSWLIALAQTTPIA